MLVVLTGIPGTGKTTVANKALGELSDEGIKYELVTYGDIMFDIGSNLGLVKDRDDMRKLKSDEQKKIQRLAGVKIGQIAEEKDILLDTHCTISTPKGFLPGFPEWVLRELSPKIFVLVEADPEEIDLRRSSDKTRKRDKDNIGGIRTHQELNRSIAMSYSIFSGCTVKIILNPQGRLEQAVAELKEVLS
ncbi:MAG: adenylate kinase [Candidatus Altiarchaeales archaeon ex4484_96]|nr:MAG: adenylate kinase [Candidatus Altiarchaeales archaeon ex4484_96]